MATDETLMDIGDSLRFVLFGLSCALNVEFDPSAVERLFDEAEGEDASSAAKRYTFHTSARLSVTGRVDEYEPETVWLRVESRRPLGPSLSSIAERAQCQAYQIRRRQDAEP